jgi:GNAT superfamily N-acetyltransferase
MNVRCLWLSDLAAFQAHLNRLDHETLHDRFETYPSEAFLNSYAEICLTDGSAVYGYFDGGVLRGAGELRFDTSGDGAEAAFSVEPEWRRKGIGAALFERVIRKARNRGVNTLSVLCLPNNQAMLQLARKFEAELRFETDAVTGRLVARKLSAVSLWSEYVDDSFSFADALFDVQRQLWSSLLIRPVGAGSR